jgi:hypothetical protein
LLYPVLWAGRKLVDADFLLAFEQRQAELLKVVERRHKKRAQKGVLKVLKYALMGIAAGVGFKALRPDDRQNAKEAGQLRRYSQNLAFSTLEFFYKSWRGATPDRAMRFVDRLPPGSSGDDLIRHAIRKDLLRPEQFEAVAQMATILELCHKDQECQDSVERAGQAVSDKLAAMRSEDDKEEMPLKKLSSLAADFGWTRWNDDSASCWLTSRNEFVLAFVELTPGRAQESLLKYFVAFRTKRVW